jgi:hypothetical protein
VQSAAAVQSKKSKTPADIVSGRDFSLCDFGKIQLDSSHKAERVVLTAALRVIHCFKDSP